MPDEDDTKETMSNSVDSLPILIRKRGSVKMRLTNFDKYVFKYPVDTMLPDAERDALELRLTKMETLSLEYDDLQLQIECLCADPEEQYIERELFETKYYNAIVRARALVAQSKPVRSSCNGSQVQPEVGCNQEDNDQCSDTHHSGSSKSRPYHIRMPPISLPKFDGNFQNWLEFRDTFLSLVHKNDSLDPINKLHYLRSSLEGGRASGVLSSLAFTAKNYPIAWNMVVERFDNNKLLVNNYIKALFDAKQPRETSKDLRDLVDTFNKNLRSLEALGEVISGWDTLLIYILTTKLDSCTLKEWETYRSSLEEVNYAAFDTFLKSRANLLESIEGHNKAKTLTPPKPLANRGLVTVNNNSSQSPWKCVVCKGDHTIYSCVDFLKEPITKRKKLVIKLKLCQNCLRLGHTVNNCRHTNCRVCNKRHNSLLHVKDEEGSSDKEQAETSKIVTTTARTSQQVLLSTACVKLFDNEGNAHSVRALLDCGSTSCFVTEKLAKVLQPTMIPVNTTVTGLNNRPSSICNKCVLQLQSVHDKFEAAIDCYVIPHITEPLPAYKMNIEGLQIPANIDMADPEFATPGDIDLLLGADIFWDLIETRRVKLGKDQPTLQDTKLGWVVSGSVPASPKIRCHFASTIDVQEQLTKFWQLEEVSMVKPWSKDDHICEKIFKESTERLSDGRFLVQVPLKQEASALGDSFSMAERRFLSLERKLLSNPKLFTSYKEFLDEYETMGHMSKVTGEDKVETAYYLPHHAVIREDSLTTKLRVVFDASMKTSNGLSFNDIQLVGPVVQNDILAILLRFRQHAIVVSADIAKMYRQVLVRPEQRPLQRIIWRDNRNDPYTIFQLNTVTYGTASAPYLAIRCLKQLADDCEDRSIGTVIEHDFYVDDLLSGADSVEEATRICQQVNNQLLTGCFELRKWRSNNETVLKNLSDVAADCEYTFNESPVSKTLGLLWNSQMDTLGYKITVSTSDEKPVTKRSILATISQIFDPLGLVSPTVIQTKVLLQQLWLQKLNWDDSVSIETSNRWMEIVQTLNHLNTLSIPRHVSQSTQRLFEVHIFSDASEAAYGACAYVRSINNDDTVHIRLLCAKAKVSPLKSTTLPRLELCGALVASRICEKIKKSLRVSIDKFVFWCDSSIVLGWLGTQPNNLKTFVRNRVSKIQEATAPHTWRYVASEANPADVLSRGIKADAIEKHELWWQGPSFLTLDEKQWPTHEYINAVELPEQRIVSNVVNEPQNLVERILTRCSTLTKAKRVMAYVLRFIRKTRNVQTAQHLSESLSCDELDEALTVLIKDVQARHFSKEINMLNKNKELPSKSSIIKLHAFVCPKGLLRIRGRLSQSKASYDVRHPIILPKRDSLTTKIFEDQHRRLLHAGPQLLLAEVRQRYWPIGGRNLARSIVHKCVTCIKLAARVNYPVMGDLPSARVEALAPFDVTGLDYAGPIMISSKKGRGAKYLKAYICVFVCFATKAIHLELATDLTSVTFILALKRFIARRGKPSHIHCDNGSNFVGGWNEIKPKLSDDFANEGIQFHFIPPHAPHFGGLWEAGVKSTKHHLKRTLGLAHLTYEELTTTLSQIEAILNSRPLTPLSSSPNDLVPLTPGHFLIGRPLTALPEPTCTVSNARQRHERVEELRQRFWCRWRKEYLSQLQERTKWNTKAPSINVGDLVVVKEDFAAPLKWHMGRVVATHPGDDGIVRVVEVFTGSGTCRRPVTKIVPLISSV